MIARALKRRGERYYHPTYNNCEHFVIWCICGLSTSLQVTPERHVGYDTLTEVIIEGLCQLIAIKFKKGTIAAEIISDLTEILGCYMRETYLNGEDLGQTFSRKHFAKTVIGLFFRLVGIAVGAWFYGWNGARIGSVMGRFVGYMTASIAIQAIEHFKDPEQFVIANITTDIVTVSPLKFEKTDCYQLRQTSTGLRQKLIVRLITMHNVFLTKVILALLPASF